MKINSYSVGLQFVCDLGQQISRVTNDRRKTSFPFQLISVAIRRFDFVVFHYFFRHTLDNTANLPEHTHNVHF
jgi:hypothetical protein